MVLFNCCNVMLRCGVNTNSGVCFMNQTMTIREESRDTYQASQRVHTLNVKRGVWYYTHNEAPPTERWGDRAVNYYYVKSWH